MGRTVETVGIDPMRQYVQLERVTKRRAHGPFQALVVPVDDPFWATHYPPNGYFCACTNRQVSARALERRGLSVTSCPPVSIGPASFGHLTPHLTGGRAVRLTESLSDRGDRDSVAKWPRPPAR